MLQQNAFRQRRWITKPSTVRDGLLLSASVVVQLILAFFLGNAYDMRIFMATGYLTGHGLNPYIGMDLSGVFHSPGFKGITSIGYPPPWALVTGLVYLATYHFVPNLLLYNLALKLPIIGGNIGLAFLARKILNDQGIPPERSRWAWIFLLFNPFLLLTSSAWGQFDPLLALLALSSLYYLEKGKTILPAALLALAISMKPTAIPIVPVAGAYLAGRSLKRAAGFLGSLSFFGPVFCVMPFYVFHWSLSPILTHWNNQFTVGGALSFMTFLEYIQWSYTLPAQWWFLGWLWVPAVGAALLTLRRGIVDFKDLLVKSTGFVLVFFLARSWVSETNLNLILPFMVLLVAMGEFNPLVLTGIWVIPLVFSFFNTDLAQLLFPSMPVAMEKLLYLAVQFSIVRYAMRTLAAALWLAVGGTIAWRCLIPTRAALPEPI